MQILSPSLEILFRGLGKSCGTHKHVEFSSKDAVSSGFSFIIPHSNPEDSELQKGNLPKVTWLVSGGVGVENPYVVGDMDDKCRSIMMLLEKPCLSITLGGP